MSLLDRPDSQVIGFIFRGQLADVAIEAQLAPKSAKGELSYADVSDKVSLRELDPDVVDEATKMAPVYIAIAGFENMVRKLISDRLLEQKGADWWNQCVSDDIRRRADAKMKDEEKIRWHGTRGLSPMCFTELKDLASVINTNWPDFQDLLPSVEWARQIIRTIDRSRNVIMHSGQLSGDDIERVGMNVRDWVRQVGT